MRKAITILSILMVFAVAASAQVPNPVSFYGGGAVSVPSGEGFSNGWKTGWHGHLGIGYKMTPLFQVVGKAEFHNFAANLEGLALDGGNTKITMFGADGRYQMNMPSAPIKPFFFGGVGLANWKIDDFTGNSLIASALNAANPGTQSKLYWNVGAGADFKVGPTASLFIQGRYVSITGDGGSLGFIPITLGLKFF